MKDVKVSIGATTIKSVKYDNNFNTKPGEQMKLAVKTQVAVRLNPAAPTTAMVLVKYECGDEEKKSVTLEMETLTPITVSTFVDNLDEVVKKNYLNHVMLGVNEKIHTISSQLGVTISTPPIPFPYNDAKDGGSIDAEILTKL